MKFTLALLSLVLLVVPALGATTGTLTLTGTVPAATSIVISPTAPYSALDLSTSQSNLLVANVTESNNTQLGYKVFISSGNAGLLKNGALGSLAYTAKYAGVSFILSATQQQVTNQGAQALPISTSKALTIGYTGQPPAGQMAGAYSDTLTFTIQAN